MADSPGEATRQTSEHSTPGDGILSLLPDSAGDIIVSEIGEREVVLDLLSKSPSYRAIKVMRSVEAPNVAEKLSFLQRIRHQNFVNV